jgi:hypothetical protein
MFEAGILRTRAGIGELSESEDAIARATGGDAGMGDSGEVEG